MFNTTTIPVLEQVVSFAQARHNVLAGNIANMDTPGYRVRDLSPELFQTRLQEAIDVRDRGAASPGFGGVGNNPLDEVKASLTGILRHDENNAGLEQQVAEMTKNQAQHNMAVSILASQFRLLQAAISERV